MFILELGSRAADSLLPSDINMTSAARIEFVYSSDTVLPESRGDRLDSVILTASPAQLLLFLLTPKKIIGY